MNMITLKILKNRIVNIFQTVMKTKIWNSHPIAINLQTVNQKYTQAILKVSPNVILKVSAVDVNTIDILDMFFFMHN